MSNPNKRLTPIHRERLRPWLEQLVRAWEINADPKMAEADCPLCIEAEKREERSQRRWDDLCGYCPIWREEGRERLNPCAYYMPLMETESGLSRCSDPKRILRWLKRELKKVERNKQ